MTDLPLDAALRPGPSAVVWEHLFQEGVIDVDTPTKFAAQGYAVARQLLCEQELGSLRNLVGQLLDRHRAAAPALLKAFVSIAAATRKQP